MAKALDGVDVHVKQASDQTFLAASMPFKSLGKDLCVSAVVILAYVHGPPSYMNPTVRLQDDRSEECTRCKRRERTRMTNRLVLCVCMFSRTLLIRCCWSSSGEGNLSSWTTQHMADSAANWTAPTKSVCCNAILSQPTSRRAATSETVAGPQTLPQ